jgi:hypothetical protein
VTPERVQEWEAEIAREVDESIASADADPLEPVADLTRYLTTVATDSGHAVAARST